MLDNQFVNLIVLQNPFDPKSGIRDVAEYSGASIDAYLGDLEPGWVITLNGGVVDPQRFALTIPQAGDWIVVAPDVTSGGGGSSSKQILRIAALLAVAVFAPYAAMGIMNVATVAELGAAGMMLAGAITVGGSMIVNAVLPPPGMDTKTDDFSSSPTYGIDGPKNTSVANIPVPVCFGEHRMGGNFVSIYTENREDKQYLRLLINAGAGPISDITGIEINDQPIASFANVAVHKRLGYDNQDYIPGFSDIITPVNRSLTLNDTTPVMHETDECEQVRVDFVLPEGLGRFSGSGKFRTHSVELEIAIKAVEPPVVNSIDELPTYIVQWLQRTGLSLEDWVASATTWQPLVWRQGTVVTPLGGSLYHTIPTSALVPVSTVTITGRSKSPVRRSYTSQPLPRGRYQIRVNRKAPGGVSTDELDMIVLTDVNEITFGGPRFNFTALLGLEIQLDEQLNSIPKVTFINKGKLVKVWNPLTRQWTYQASKNPAWQVYHALTDTRDGAGFPESRIDLAQFKVWAKYCDENGLTFNGVIDQAYSLWDALAPIFRAGRAMPTRSGTQYSVSIEMPKQPAMMFSAANIRSGSFAMSWLPLEDMANELEISFYDKNQGYEQRTISVADDDQIAARGKVVKSQMTLVGITDEELAIRHGIYALNYNKLGMTCSFDAPIEAIACSLGDLVLVQHDMPQWGFSGRLAANSPNATTLLLDKPVKMGAGNSYKILLKFDAPAVLSGTVNFVSGNTVYLNGFHADLSPEVKVLKINGLEYLITERVADYANSRHGVVVNSVTGISAGQSYTLYDTDLTLTANVTTVPGETTTLTLAAPITSNGASLIASKDMIWAFGRVDKGPKPFTVRRIRASDDGWRTLECLEYDERVFDDEIIDFIPSHSEIDNGLGPVTLLSIHEELAELDGAYQTMVVVEFEHSSAAYARANVYVAAEAGEYYLVGTGIRSVSFPSEPGIRLQIKIQPVSNTGRTANFESLPVYEYTVAGATPTAPNAPINFVAFPKIRSVDLRWYTLTYPGPGNFENIGLFEIWYAPITDAQPNPTIENAVLIATVESNYYEHLARTPKTKHRYWIRERDRIRADVYSGWAPNLDGLTVETLLDTDFDIIFPSGVDSSHLAPALQSRIIDLEAGNIQSVAGSYFHGFEDAEIDSWAPNGGSITQSTDKFSGTKSALFSSSSGGLLSGGTTDVPYLFIAEKTAMAFSGRRIRVSIYAKKPATNASDEFAISYSTADAGDSGWQRFNPTTSWQYFSVEYDVPPPGAGIAADYLGVWGDTANAGNGVLIDHLRIELIDPNFVDQQEAVGQVWDAMQAVVSLADTLVNDMQSLLDSNAEMTTTVNTITLQVGDLAVQLDTTQSTLNDFSSQLQQIEAVQSDQISVLQSLATSHLEQSSQITNLQNTQASQAQTLQSLQTTVGNHTSQIQAINQTTGDQANQINLIKSELSNIGQAYSDMFTDAESSLANWIVMSGVGERSIITVSDSPVGGRALKLGNNAGNDEVRIALNHLIPFDETKIYRISTAVKRLSGAGVYGVGFLGVGADGQTLVSVTGANTAANAHMHAANAQTAGPAFTPIVGYTSGYATGTANAGPNNDISNPGKVHAQVRYLRPYIIANLNGASGELLFSHFTVDVLTPDFSQLNGMVLAQASAIQSVQTAVSNQNGAIEATTTAIEQIQAIVGSDYSALQEMKDVIVGPDGISATYQLKMDVNGHVVGIGLWNDGETSEFAIVADKFVVVRPGSTNKTFPFQIVNGTVVIDGTIIRDATIGNAQIAGLLTSNNYIPGQTGWAINKTTGAAEFGAITIRASDGSVLLASGGDISPYLDNRLQQWSDIKGPNKPADGATRNNIYRQTTPPANAVSGDLWYNTTTAILYRYTGSAWEFLSNGYTNTSQLADDAGLGQRAVWENITGAAKPADGATKNVIYRQPTTPGGSQGDLWQNTNTGYLYRHSGTGWELISTVGADGSNLLAGRGTNMLFNTTFVNNSDGWYWTVWGGGSSNYSTGRNLDSNWTLKGEGTMYATSTDTTTNYMVLRNVEPIPVIPGVRYELSAYTGAHRCNVQVRVFWYDQDGNSLSDIPEQQVGETNAAEYAGGQKLNGYKRIGGIVTAPANAHRARIGIRKSPTLAGNNSSYMFVSRPFFGEAGAQQAELSPWVDGSPKGAFSTLDQINQTNISTYIASASIDTLRVGGNMITATFSGSWNANWNGSNGNVFVPGQGSPTSWNTDLLWTYFRVPPQSVVVMCNVQARAFGDSTNCVITLMRNGQNRGSIPVTLVKDATTRIPVIFIDYPPEGFVSYQVVLTNNWHEGAYTVANVQIVALGTLR